MSIEHSRKMAQTGSKGNSKQKKINCDEFGKKITLSDVMNDMTFVDKLEELEEKKGIERCLDGGHIPSERQINVNKLYFIRTCDVTMFILKTNQAYLRQRDIGKKIKSMSKKEKEKFQCMVNS